MDGVLPRKDPEGQVLEAPTLRALAATSILTADLSCPCTMGTFRQHTYSVGSSHLTQSANSFLRQHGCRGPSCFWPTHHQATFSPTTSLGTPAPVGSCSPRGDMGPACVCSDQCLPCLGFVSCEVWFQDAHITPFVPRAGHGHNSHQTGFYKTDLCLNPRIISSNSPL